MSHRCFAQPASTATLAALILLGGAAPAFAQLVKEPTNHHPNPYTTINDRYGAEVGPRQLLRYERNDGR